MISSAPSEKRVSLQKQVCIIQYLHSLQAAVKILVEQDMGIIPLYHSTKPYVYNKSVVTNVQNDANGQMMLTDVILLE